MADSEPHSVGENASADDETQAAAWWYSLSPDDKRELARLSEEVDFSEVEETDWTSFGTAFGNASTFPQLLRAASRRQQWRKPLEQLLTACCSMNEVHPAAVPTLPYLIRLIDYNPPSRQSILLEELANWIWSANWSDSVLDEGSIEHTVRHAILSHREVFVDLLRSDHPNIQQGAQRILEELDTELRPCPNCGSKLRTSDAKQCFHCGSDWH